MIGARTIAAAIAIAVAACGSQTRAPVDASPAQVGGALAFDGVVRASDDVRTVGKTFRGAWIERDDGERWVIDYDPDSPFRALRDTRVHVEGERYVPDHQALVGPHFRVQKLTAQDARAALSSVGPRVRLRGHFDDVPGEKGSLSEGETIHRFVDASGRAFFLARAPEGTHGLGGACEIDAYEVEIGPSTQHLGGPTLWILRVDPSH